MIAYVKYLKYLVYAALVVVSLFLAKTCTDLSSARRSLADERKSKNTELTKVRNELGEETATREILFRRLEDMRAQRDSKDKELARVSELADEYKKRLSSATVFVTETRIPEVKAPAITKEPIAPGDSLQMSATIADSAGWYSMQVRATKPPGEPGSFTVSDLSIRNGFEVTQRRDAFGFLNLRNRDILEIKSTNPYTTTNAAQTYLREDKKANRGVWAGAGAAVVVILRGLFLN